MGDSHKKCRRDPSPRNIANGYQQVSVVDHKEIVQITAYHL